MIELSINTYLRFFTDFLSIALFPEVWYKEKMLDWLRTQELNYLDLWIPFECVAKTKTFSITIQQGREGLNSKDPFFHWIITMMMMMVGPLLPS